jgi:chaperonin cofactor prefoldin
MEAEQVLQRLGDLEARIVSIEAKDGPVELDLDELKAKLARTVLRCTPRALELWLREIPSRARKDIFYGVSRPVLLKLRECMSSRAWDDLLTAWKQGEANLMVGRWEVKNALLIFTQLTEMGTLSEEEPDGPVDKGQVYQFHSTPEADAKALAAHRQKLEQEMQEARDWLSRELQA